MGFSNFFFIYYYFVKRNKDTSRMTKREEIQVNLFSESDAIFTNPDQKAKFV